jgi:hypothetical protein
VRLILEVETPGLDGLDRCRRLPVPARYPAGRIECCCHLHCQELALPCMEQSGNRWRHRLLRCALTSAPRGNPQLRRSISARQPSPLHVGRAVLCHVDAIATSVYRGDERPVHANGRSSDPWLPAHVGCAGAQSNATLPLVKPGRIASCADPGTAWVGHRGAARKAAAALERWRGWPACDPWCPRQDSSRPSNHSRCLAWQRGLYLQSPAKDRAWPSARLRRGRLAASWRTPPGEAAVASMDNGTRPGCPGNAGGLVACAAAR